MLLAAGVACADGSSLGPGPQPGAPAALTIVSGAEQTGTVGSTLAAPIVAQVTDAWGQPVPGVMVTFAAADGAGEFSPAGAATDEAGNAGSRWTLGTTSGSASGTARTADLTAAFSASALPGPPMRLEVAAGEDQTAPAGGPVPVGPAVAVLDAAGNPVPGLEVSFTVISGGGTATPARVTTGADGVAAVEAWVLGETAGTNTLQATLETAPAAAVELEATGVAGPVDPVRSTVSATPSSVRSGETASIRLVARDAHGNPIAGAAAALTASGSGNTIVQPPATNANGAAGGSLTPEGAGTRVVSAEVNGVPLAGSATVEVAAPPTVASVTVTPGTLALAAGQSGELTAAVLDPQGAPVDGAQVEWSSSRPDIAAVDPSGAVSALARGTATITARSGGRSGTSAITVSYGAGTVTGLRYCTMDGSAVRMDLFVPGVSVPRPLPVAVHVHGGGWVSGSRTRGVWFAEIRDALLARGYLVVSVDYRLAPEHLWPAQIHDVKCAIRHLRANASTYGLDPERIGVWGASAGGQLVGLLGTAGGADGFDVGGEFPGVSSRVQAVVAMSPITDFTTPVELFDDYSRVFATWPDPDSPEMVQASPVTHVTTDDSPFFFVAGEDDTLVLPAQSARLDQLLRSAGIQSSLLMIHNADHGLRPTTAPIDPGMEEVIDRIGDFLDRHLR